KFNTSDQESDDLTASIVKEPSCGSHVINHDAGSLFYTAKSTPSLSDSACIGDQIKGWNDSFTYKVNDGKQDSKPATVTVRINQTIPPPTTNNAPIAYDIHGETEPDKSVEIKFNTSDQESDDLTASIVKEPSCG